MFHLVYIWVFISQCVILGVHHVEQVDNLHGVPGLAMTEISKSRDSTEHDGHLLVFLGWDWPSVAQFLGD